MTAEEFRYAFLKIFLPRLAEIIPKLVYCWRLEFHESGYPHLHMFAWTFEKERKLESEFYKRQIRNAWREAICDHSRAAQLHSCKIKLVTSFQQTVSYVAKYTAKEETTLNMELTGRRWAISKNFPASPITEIPLTREQAEKVRDIAREIVNQRNKRSGSDFSIDGDETEIFIWLDPDKVKSLLSLLCRRVELEEYDRVLKRGSPERTPEELNELTAGYGYSF